MLLAFVARSRLAVFMAVAIFQGMSTAYRAQAQMMLYEDQLPEGYAYVRFINVTSEKVMLRPVGFADPIALGTSGADRVSAYQLVENAATRKLSADLEAGRQIHFELKPGAFQTLLIDRLGEGFISKVVTDHLELSQTKARLSFYNAIPSCASAGLYLEPAGQAVFKDLGPDLMRGRAVNPATNPRVRAACGVADVAALNLGPLDAGGQYSLWLLAPSGSPTAFISKNTIAPFVR